ncbi:MAG TPA: hypothetical protein VMW01_09925 [Williamwhitmania sp.]|nr:hypothetical protein [Williamwhitmania sp.]
MKKSTFLKIALTLASALFVSGAMAQGDAADYSLISADATPNATYVTQGMSVPVYVQPDAIYNPSWVFPSTGLTAGFTWVVTSASSPANITFIQPSSLNYVEISGVTVGGPYAVNVYEQAPAAFGGCHDAGIDFNVFVTGKPTAAVSGSAVAAWTVDAAGHQFHVCGDQGPENLSVAITETGAPVANAGYAYSIQKRSVNIDAADVEIPASVVTSLVDDHTTAAKYHGAGPEVVSTGALTVLNLKRTKYTFTLLKASDLLVATPEGIVSAISQKSDYVAANVAGGATAAAGNITTYPFTGTVTVEYIVNPTPVTGPVYHIANAFAY